jgi:hypothetical protein
MKYQILFANIGRQLRHVRISRLYRSTRGLVASSIIPFINPLKIETLHCDYDCCVPLMILLRSMPKQKSQLREITIPVHGSDFSDHCSAAEPQILGKLIASRTGKLEVLRLAAARDVGSVPKSLSTRLITPIIQANRATLKEIVFGVERNAILDVAFPEFKQMKEWGKLPALFPEKFGIPLSVLKFQCGKQDGVELTITAAGEFCNRFKESAAGQINLVTSLCEACHPKGDSYEEIDVKLSDYITIIERMRKGNDLELQYWVLDRCQEIWRSALEMSFPLKMDRLLFAFLRVKELESILPRIKPQLATIPDLLGRLATGDRFMSTWEPTQVLKTLIEDIEWCDKAGFDINRTFSDKPFISHIFRDAEVFVAAVKTHQERLNLKITEEENLLQWVYGELFWQRHRLDRYKELMQAVWQICAARDRSMIVYPSQISIMKWICGTEELRNCIAESMADWKRALNPRIVRKACFGDLDDDLEVADLKKMCEYAQGQKPLSPENSVKVSEFIWLRMIATPGKEDFEVSDAADLILPVFPTLPPKLLRFIVGKTNFPLKNPEKITSFRAALLQAMKRHNLDCETLAVVAKVK